jgi:RNA polymerase sigma-70 factor (ECF subfamily)
MSDGPGESALDIRLLADKGRGDSTGAGLEQEVTHLFELWRPALLRYLLSSFGLPLQDGEEIVQEVFLELFHHLRKQKARTNLRGWLFRVAHNLALKRRNAEWNRSVDAHLDHLPHPALNPEQEVADSQRQQHLSSILHALPEQDRRCICLRAEGLRYREIAEVLGMSLGSVAASLARSLARFERADR